MKITNELKTGALVVAALFTGFVFLFKTTDLTSGKPYHVRTTFTYAEGIKADSIVKLAGVEVGRVKSVQFDYTNDTKVELVLELSPAAKAREDSLAFITTSGMIGDAYVGLTAGSPDKPFAKEGAMLASEDPIQMRMIMKKMEAIAENLDTTLVEFKKLAQNVNGVVGGNKTRIDSMVSNLEQTAINFKEFSEDIKAHPWKLLAKGK